MEVLKNLLADVSLLLILLVATMFVYFITVNCSSGLAGFHSLRLTLLSNWFQGNPAGILFPIFFVIIPVSSLTLISWAGSEVAYLLSNQFTVLDASLVCIFFFSCMFAYLASGSFAFISSPFSWEGLDSALTPTTIVTSFISLGFLITYYHHI
jgi:hypothetical protein